jgi:hypothetical protein
MADAESVDSNAVFIDTPVLQAKRRAFDDCTQANLDALIAAAKAETLAGQEEAHQELPAQEQRIENVIPLLEIWRRVTGPQAQLTGALIRLAAEVYKLGKAAKAEDVPQPNLGADTPWPLRDVLLRLAAAGEHLLRFHDCDVHGWEGIDAAVKAARRIANQIAKTEDAPAPPRWQVCVDCGHFWSRRETRAEPR